MHTLPITIERAKALALYQQYRKHVHYSQPIDRECMRAYELLSKGKLVIKALESIQTAGLKTEGPDAGYPKLAICRADAIACECRIENDGQGYMRPQDFHPRSRTNWGSSYYDSSRNIQWPRGSFADANVQRRQAYKGLALVPTPPVHLRPKRGLQNYHILWEAEWTKIVPVDPYLLRRIGRADLWLVVAMWELSEVERAALKTRLTV